jgi:uncharacterized protein YndB with AHSA1/START domain
MPDILQDFPIRATPARVFDAVSAPAGLDVWWTKRCAGEPARGAEYELDFGPGYSWRAIVTLCEAPIRFELRITEADADWTGTLVGFELTSIERGTWVRFSHRGWPAANEHYRVSVHCWAMYLRLLRRHLEEGEVVEYERRLDV